MTSRRSSPRPSSPGSQSYYLDWRRGGDQAALTSHRARRPARAAQAAASGDSRDYGLFGPGSVTWRLASEPVMWIAGVRAMYMQALHPRVMLGTWQNTALAKPDQAWGRFTRTVEFVRVRTYGTTAEVDRAAARLRKVHSSLTAVDADGTRFRLDDPELLLWVHCGEIGSYAEIARRSGVHVTAGRAGHAFVAEQRRERGGRRASARRSSPASMAELAAYYQRMRPRPARDSPEARRAAAGYILRAPAAASAQGVAARRTAGERAGVRELAALGAPAVRHAGDRLDRRGRNPGAAGSVRVQHPDPAAPAVAGRAVHPTQPTPAASSPDLIAGRLTGVRPCQVRRFYWMQAAVPGGHWGE